MVDGAAYRDLHAFTLGFPEAYEEQPWGHPAIKVKGKVFAFMSAAETEDGSLTISVKLPHSSGPALMFDFASPTGYGLGKSGWVTARFAATDEVPVELLKQWIDESYRAVAPKSLAASLPAKS